MITDINTRANETLTCTTFTAHGVRCELVTHKTGKGRIEVYVEYADCCGLLRFEGYYDEVCMTSPRTTELVASMLGTHTTTHANFWRNGYLPGASTWMHAA